MDCAAQDAALAEWGASNSVFGVRSRGAARAAVWRGLGGRVGEVEAGAGDLGYGGALSAAGARSAGVYDDVSA